MIEDIYGREDFEQKVLRSSHLCVVKFYKEDCYPCEVVEETLEKWKKEYRDIKFYKVEYRYRGNWNICMRYKVKYYPTVVTFKSGIVKNTAMGTRLNKNEVLCLNEKG